MGKCVNRSAWLGQHGPKETMTTTHHVRPEMETKHNDIGNNGTRQTGWIAQSSPAVLEGRQEYARPDYSSIHPPQTHHGLLEGIALCSFSSAPHRRLALPIRPSPFDVLTRQSSRPRLQFRTLMTTHKKHTRRKLMIPFLFRLACS
jgi:hypothetical protein